MKNIIIFALVFMFAFLPTEQIFAGGDWGLGFPTPGQTPQGNETAEFLKKYDSYYVDPSGEKVIYLTFDAGFENGLTESILNTLEEKQVPAAFFLVGTYIRDHADLVTKMLADGHIVANHTMSHPDMSAISDRASFQKELAQTEEEYQKVTGQNMPKFYRPPRGKYSEENIKMAKELGYKTIFWSLAYMDWDQKKQPTKEAAFSKLIPRIHPGAIVLLHSTSKTNAEILGELIDKYKEMGYTFKSLNELAA